MCGNGNPLMTWGTGLKKDVAPHLMAGAAVTALRLSGILLIASWGRAFHGDEWGCVPKYRATMIFAAADLPSFDNWYKALGTLGAFGTFLWTVYTWREKSLKELEASKDDAKRANRARIIEATKPFLDLQLMLYTNVTRAAALIATSEDEGEVKSSMHDFLRLYSGELALVENEDVATAMQNFRRAITGVETRGAVQSADNSAQKPLVTIEEREGILQLSLQLARACRNSLAKSWHVEAWANPDDAI